MKKSTLKEKLALSITKEVIAMNMLRGVIEKLNDTEEALDRRRILYDRLINHSTKEKPKSMREMAEDLYDIYMKTQGVESWMEFEDLLDDEQDKWMDKLLTILN